MEKYRKVYIFSCKSFILPDIFIFLHFLIHVSLITNISVLWFILDSCLCIMTLSLETSSFFHCTSIQWTYVNLLKKEIYNSSKQGIKLRLCGLCLQKDCQRRGQEHRLPIHGQREWTERAYCTCPICKLPPLYLHE